MKIGIIAAMEEELRHLVDQLEDRHEEIVMSNRYHLGKIAGHDLVLVQSGVGKVMSALTVAILVETFKVDALINTGSAGAVASHLQIGDVVVADRLVYHDVDLTAFGYDYGQMSMQPLYFQADTNFVETFEEVLKKKRVDTPSASLRQGIPLLQGKIKLTPLKITFQMFLLSKWKVLLLHRRLWQLANHS